jgi:hypothetical protein
MLWWLIPLASFGAVALYVGLMIWGWWIERDNPFSPFYGTEEK